MYIGIVKLTKILQKFDFNCICGIRQIFILPGARRALTGDYNLHHVCAYVRSFVCHAVFSETTTVTHF